MARAEQALVVRDPDTMLDDFRASLIEARLTLEGRRGVALEGEVLGPGDGADILYHPTPFKKETRRLSMPAGGTIADAIAMTGCGPGLVPHLGVYLGDERVPRAMWDKVRPKAGSALYIRLELSGGDSGKDILRTILSIVVIIVAFYAGPWVAGALKLGGAVATGVSALTSALVLTAGQALVNHLIPPPKPNTSFGFDQQPGNPYAALTGLSNRMVPYGPIPRVLGARRMFPMLAARPYTEMQGKNQFLRMLLLVGYGPIDVSDLRIGNTPITAYAGAQYEIREGWDDDAAVTLFTRSISEESLSILLEPLASPTSHTTDPDTIEGSIDITFPYGLVSYDTEGNKTNRTIQVVVQYDLGGGNWQDVVWINGDTALGTGTTGQIIVSNAAQEVVVASGRWKFPSAGTWTVRMGRITAAGTSTQVDTAYWTVLRSIKNDAPVNLPGLCLIALRLQATAQLNGTPDTINCLAQAYHPVYDPEAEDWDYQLTRNPAWEYADLLRRRGLKTILEDNRIDLEGIVEWAQACDEDAPNAAEPRWQCDLVIEQSSIFTALQSVAAHGRAQFAIVDGKYSIVRDVEQTTPVQYISPRNSSGYRGSKAFVDIPHAFRVGFINPDKDDAPDEVIVYRDGYAATTGGGNIAATKFDTLDLPGCRSSTQAWREGRYNFAQLQLRPEEHSVTMDVEAIRCTKGDLVRFSHDVIGVGLGSGRISGRTNSGGNITALDLDSPIDMEAAIDYGLRIRHADGTGSVHAIATQVGTKISTIDFVTPVALAVAPEIGDLFQFGVIELESAPMLVKSIEHASQLTARVSMVDAQAGVYTADTGEIPAFNTYITNGRPARHIAPTAPTITLRSDETALLRARDGTLTERIMVDLSPPGVNATPSKQWEVEARRNDSNGDWIEVAKGAISKRRASINDVRAGELWDVRARLISVHDVVSEWTEVLAHTVIGKSTAPNPPSAFSVVATLDGVNISFTPSTSLDIRNYEVRVGGANWAAATWLGNVAGPKAFFTYALAGATTFRIKAKDVIGLYSTEVTDSSVTANTAGALATRNATTYRQSSAPSSPIEGDLWVDTGTTGEPVKRRTSGAWVLVADQTGINTAAAILGQSDLATLGSTTVLSYPPGVQIGCVGDVKFTRNKDGAGATNNGEIRVQGTTLYVADRGAVTISQTVILTPFETSGGVSGRAFIILSSTNAGTRFGGGFDGTNGPLFVAIYNWATEAWTAYGDTSSHAMTLEEDDVIVGHIKRTAEAGIGSLQTLIARNANILTEWVTANGVAAAVTGQGALATQNSANASQINVGDHVNQIKDPLFSDESGSWSFTLADTSINTAIKTNLFAPKGARYQGAGQSSANASSVKLATSQVCKVKAGAGYRLYVDLRYATVSGSGFTGRFRVVISWLDQDGTTVLSTTTVNGTDYRTVAAAALTAYLESNVIADASAAFAQIDMQVLWSSTLTNAGICYAANPLLEPTKKLGKTVMREDGVTVVADADAITSLGTAAAITGQGGWATASSLNVNGGVSGTFTVAPITVASVTSTSIPINATTYTGPNGVSVSVPSGTISGLSVSTKYYVFRDVTGGSFSATSSASTARSRYNDTTNQWLSLGIITTPASGSGGTDGGAKGGQIP